MTLLEGYHSLLLYIKGYTHTHSYGGTGVVLYEKYKSASRVGKERNTIMRTRHRFFQKSPRASSKK